MADQQTIPEQLRAGTNLRYGFASRAGVVLEHLAAEGKAPISAVPTLIAVGSPADLRCLPSFAPFRISLSRSDRLRAHVQLDPAARPGVLIGLPVEDRAGG